LLGDYPHDGRHSEHCREHFREARHAPLCTAQGQVCQYAYIDDATGVARGEVAEDVSRQRRHYPHGYPLRGRGGGWKSPKALMQVYLLPDEEAQGDHSDAWGSSSSAAGASVCQSAGYDSSRLTCSALTSKRHRRPPPSVSPLTSWTNHCAPWRSRKVFASLYGPASVVLAADGSFFGEWPESRDVIAITCVGGGVVKAIVESASAEWAI